MECDKRNSIIKTQEQTNNMNTETVAATLTFLVASEGMLLTDGKIAVQSVVLPSPEQASLWHEISESEWVEPEEDDDGTNVDITRQLQQVIEIITHYADNYGATQELLAMDDINIETLDALIAKYNVSDKDKNDIMFRVQMIVLDLMGKLDFTWYDIWNGRIKPGIANAMRSMANNAQTSGGEG
jgi:hypothetical protein